MTFLPTFGVALLTLAVPALVADAQGTRSDVDARIDVGGYALHLRCAGSGTPTVVLEAGLGANSRTWQSVMPEVGKITRVCSYDRPNVGSSDPAFRALRRVGSTTYIELRAGQDLVRDLRTLLRRATEAAPYVLVGHSFGGFSAILYAHQHPDEVVGMMLVDSTHPDQVTRLQALMTAAEAKLDREGLMQNREGFDIYRILDEVRATNWHANIPLIVLAEGRPESSPTERSTKEKQIWRELQTELSRRSPRGKLFVADRSGHDIHVDQPELVIGAIRDVIAEVRNARR